MHYLLIFTLLLSFNFCEAKRPSPKGLLKKLEQTQDKTLIKTLNAVVEGFYLSYADDLALHFLSDSISDEEASLLKYLTSYSVLGGVKEINVTQLTEKGLRFAFGFSYVERITVRNALHTPIFSHYPNILSFEISESAYSCKELQELFESVDGNKLKSFTLSCGDRSDFGDAELKVCVPYFHSLTHLDLSFTPITDEGLFALAPYLRDLAHLSLNECFFITAEGLECLYVPHFRELQVDRVKKMEKVLKHLKEKLEGVEILSFSGTNITDNTLEKIAPSLSQVKNLNCSLCGRVTVKGLEALVAFLPNDPFLHFQFGNDTLTDEDVLVLAPFLSHLHNVFLDACILTDEGLLELAPYLENTHFLSLRRCKKITEKGLKKALPYMKKLNAIRLKGTSLSKDFKDELRTQGLYVD